MALDLTPEIRQRTASPRVAPPWILDRHSDHQVGDLSGRARPASTSPGAAVVFRGDQPLVPPKDGVRGDDTGHPCQCPTTQSPATHRESTALGIREAKPSPTKLLSENAILLPEIVDQVFLVTVHPTSEREHEKLQRMGHCQRLLGRGSALFTLHLSRVIAPYEVNYRASFVVSKEIEVVDEDCRCTGRRKIVEKITCGSIESEYGAHFDPTSRCGMTRADHYRPCLGPKLHREMLKNSGLPYASVALDLHVATLIQGCVDCGQALWTCEPHIAHAVVNISKCGL